MIRLVHSRAGLPPAHTPESLVQKLALIRRTNPRWWRTIQQMIDECAKKYLP